MGLFNRRPKNRTQAEFVRDWVEAEDVPRAGMPDVSELAKRARLAYIYVWAATALFPLALLSVFVIAGNKVNSSTSSPNTQDTPARATAKKFIGDWLNADPAPLPGGRILTWTSETEMYQDDPERNSKTQEGRIIVQDTFTLLDGDDNLYTASVQSAIDPRGGVVVIAGPSLTPILPPDKDSWSDGTTWPKLKNAPVTDEVKQAIDAWAEAFTSGDQKDLQRAVGDPDSQHFYMPLFGVSGVATKTREAAYKGKDSQVIVRVVLKIHWADLTYDEKDYRTKLDNMSDGNALMYYDVLIADYDTASPVVVAWGGPGEGPSLEPYENGTVRSSSVPENDMPSSVSTTTTVPDGAAEPDKPSEKDPDEPSIFNGGD